MIKYLVFLFCMFNLTACQAMGNSASEGSSSISQSLLKNDSLLFSESYASNQDVQDFIGRLVDKHDYDKTLLELAFSHIKSQPQVIEKSDNQPEVLIPFYKYKTRFVSKDRVALGAKFKARNIKWLTTAEKEFGVDIDVIVALLGVETYYGRITGSNRVFSSLTTLSFDYPRRQTYFKSELEAYLLLVREKGWKIGETKGSYTGAMGMTQFMPSNYRKLAIDYDGDGQIDLWRSEADAIGSIANYLKNHGWRSNQPWFVKAKIENLDKVKDKINHGRKANVKMAIWKQLGVEPEQKSKMSETGLIALKTSSKKVGYWLAYENFFTIMDYNPSRRYAMSVLELAEKIKHYESH